MNAAELIDATLERDQGNAQSQPADDPKPGLTTLQTHYSARAAAMKLAYATLAPLDDDARAAVYQALQDGSAASLQPNLAQFKQRLGKLLGLGAAEIAQVK